MSHPQLSIIVPVYNSEQFLAHCVDSLIQQKFPDIEILLIDDGSTDHSLELSRNYARQDARIKIFSQCNAGPGVARNLGLQNAQGKYLTFVDSDDEIAPDTFELNMQFLKEHPEIEVLQFPIITKFTSGKRKLVSDAPEILQGNQGINSLWCTPGNRITGFSCGKLYQAKLAKSVQFPTDMRNSEDSVYITRVLAQCQNFAFSSQGAYIYKLRDNSLSNFNNHPTLIQMRNDMVALFEKIDSAFILKLSHEVQLKMLSFTVTSLTNFVIDEKFHGEYLEECFNKWQQYHFRYWDIACSHVALKSKIKLIIVKFFGLKNYLTIHRFFSSKARLESK